MSNIERKYAYYDQGVLPTVGESGVTYLTLYSSEAGNIYDGWIYDPDNKVPVSVTERTFGYRHPQFSQYCWDDEVVVDLSNPQNREESDFAQGRITSFNTNVSPYPIVIQDTDVSEMTEDERERHATTILFTAIPLVSDSYIQAMIEVQCKCNLSPNNTSGEMRVEAFYILNDESDRTMRPNPVHTFSVTAPNERHTLPWLYWNPALKHEDHNYIGVKLVVTGGTLEIGISDVRDYGDAMITLVSAGLNGDIIYSEDPLYIELSGKEEVPPGYKLDIDDYQVLAYYETGEVYTVTKMCEFYPEMGSEITEELTYLTAYYGDLSDVLPIYLGQVIYIELSGNEVIHGSYTLDINDYTVLAYFDNGDVWDVTSQCTFSPTMGTTVTTDTTLTATYEPYWMPGQSFSDTLELTASGVREKKGSDEHGLIYTLYEDGCCAITGNVIPWEYTPLRNNDWYPDEWDKRFSHNGWRTTPQASSYDTYLDGYAHIVEDGVDTSVLLDVYNGSNYLDDISYSCVVCIPHFTHAVNSIEWKASGAPLGICLFRNASQLIRDRIIELKNFESIDTSKVLMLDFCYKYTKDVDLSWMNDKDFGSLISMCGCFMNTINDISTLNKLDGAKPINLCGLFEGSGIEVAPDIASIVDMSNVEYTNSMFQACNNLVDIKNTAKFNMSKVVSTVAMFEHCPNLEDFTPLGRWRYLPHLLTSALMFHFCTKLTDTHFCFGWQHSTMDGTHMFNTKGTSTTLNKAGSELFKARKGFIPPNYACPQGFGATSSGAYKTWYFYYGNQGEN